MRSTSRIAILIVAALVAAAHLHAEPVSSSYQAMPKGVPAGAEIQLQADQPSYRLGENVLLHYQIKNAGNEPIVVESGGDDRAAPRAARVRVVAKDDAGTVLKDPTPDPMHHGGFGGGGSIEPGDTFTISVPIMRYCLFDKPGKYTIRVAHDLGWGKGYGERAEFPDEDARWASVEIEFVMPSPDEADEILQAMLRSPDDGGANGEKRHPYGDLTCLRYPVYLPPLTRLAEKGDSRALAGMAYIPTPDATRAIVDCLPHDKEAVVDAAVAALRVRLPHPSLTDPTARQRWWTDAERDRQREMVKQSWRDEFAEPIMVYARQALKDAPRKGMRDDRMESAAFLIESLGTPAEMETVVQALDRMLERSQKVKVESPLIYGIIPHLQWAAEGILSRGGQVPQPPKSPGEIAVYLVATQRDAKAQAIRDKSNSETISAPALPPEFDGYAREWIDHPIPYIQRLTIESLPQPCPAWAIEPLRERLNARDVAVRYAAIEAAGKSKEASFGPALLEIVRQADDQWVVGMASQGAIELGVPRDEVLLAWADRLARADFENNYRTLNQLAGLIKHQGSSGNSNGPKPTQDDRNALKARWIAFINQHRDAIRAGKVFQASDPEISRELIPPYFSIGVAGKDWPTSPRSN